MIRNTKSQEIFERARRVIPGGINTTIRALDRAMVFTQARGSKIYDADGNEYIDYHAAFGPPILGHCHPKVEKRVIETLQKLDLIGAGTTEEEIEAAEKIIRHVPSAELVHFCNSGSEATYHAVRLSRAVTGRRKVIKFQGCYHGFHDYLCMNIITPPERMGGYDPASAGILKEALENTLVLPFNDLEAVEGVLKSGEQVAAIILEPIPHNIGCVLPKPGFLEGLRRLCDEYGVVLVFDEVITGFRHGLGGYQAICGVTPDLTTLGKAIANGYPCAAICGKKELMQRFATAGGDVFFAGTFNAHPLAMAAVCATIEELEGGEVYPKIIRLGDALRQGLKEILERAGIPAFVTGFGSVFVIYFMEPPVESYGDLLRNDSRRDLAFRWGMVDRGAFVHPMCLKRSHISAAHSEEDIARTLQAAEDALRSL